MTVILAADHPRRAIPVLAVLGTAILAIATPAMAQHVILSSDCPDGAPVCRIERPVATPPAPKAAEAEPIVTARAAGAGAQAGAVLSLSNVDLEATREDLEQRIEPSSGASTTSVAIDALPVASDPEPEPVDDWGSEPERQEVWVSVEGAETIETAGAGPRSFDECMELAIRGDVAFATAQQVCMALFAQTPVE